jgi:hypothetical protein
MRIAILCPDVSSNALVRTYSIAKVRAAVIKSRCSEV